MHRSILSIIPLLLIVWGCGFSTEKRRPKHIESTMEDRAVKRISDADIIAKAMELGDSISGTTQKAFMKNLSAAYSAGGFDSAVVFCNIEAYPITDSLAKQFSVDIKRVSSKYRNPENKPAGLEKELIEAYEYTASQDGGKPESNVQFYANKDSILFTRPIFVANKFCLNCHGTDETIDELAANQLKETYPQDHATNYELGDFRGMWSVRFLRSDLVKQL